MDIKIIFHILAAICAGIIVIVATFGPSHNKTVIVCVLVAIGLTFEIARPFLKTSEPPGPTDVKLPQKDESKTGRSQYEVISHLEKILSILERAVQDYKKNKGESTLWLAASSQLYILLVDKSNGKPLIERVIPNVKYHPLHKDMTDIAPKALLSLPKLEMSSDGITVDLFNTNAKKIPLSDWLEQTIAVLNYDDKGHPITIKKLIEYTYLHEGGGHYPSEIDSTAKALSGFMFVEGGKQAPFFQKATITIADYLIIEIRKKIDSLTGS